MSNLALDLRPTRLEDFLGNEPVKKALKSFIDRDYFPNVFLFIGPPGTGKTTLAEIVARAAGADDSCTHHINGSDQNGVDDARTLAEISSSCPLTGRRRVFIINELQRMTVQAQDCLLDPMEKNPALWLLTSTDPGKIAPAIKSRAAAATFELKPLNQSQIADLVYKAAPGAGDSEASSYSESLAKWLWTANVVSPREILGVVDQYLAGVPLDQCVHGTEHEPLYKDVAGAVVRGDWSKASGLLAQIKTADSRGLVAITSAFLRQELLKCPVGPRADGIATCLVGLDSIGFADGSAYGATTGLLYKTCKVLGVK